MSQVEESLSSNLSIGTRRRMRRGKGRKRRREAGRRGEQ
jgi:hypothetical protein